MARASQIEAAVRNHSGTVRRLLLGSGISPEDADDLLQETLVIFARRFHEVAEPAQRPFLVTTAWRLAADWRRLACNRTEVRPLDESVAEAAANLPDEVYARLESAEVAIEALAALPPDERSLLILSRWYENSRTAIADTLKLPPGTVASRLASASKNFESIAQQIQLHQMTADCVTPNPRLRRAPARSNPRLVAVSQPFAIRDVGALRYFNNQFGRGAARGSFDQCLLARDHHGQHQLGWSWNWPEHAHSLAYPQVLHGWSPWVGHGRPGDSKLPVRVGHVKKMVTHHDVQTAATGRFGLLALILLTRALRKDGKKDPGLLTSEIAVQLEVNGTAKVLGKPRASVRIGDEDYHVWLWRTLGGTDPLGLPSFVFWNGRQCRKGSTDLRALLDYLTRQRLISDDDWIVCCQLGNDISGGHGTTWVSRFEVELETF